jgi:hypothetical protein
MLFLSEIRWNAMPRPGSVKTLVDVRSLARSHTELAINTLSGIARSPKVSAQVRVAAAEALLDRGWGRPTAEPDAGSGEITVIIRQLVEPVGEPRQTKAIEHEPIRDPD